MVRVQEPQVLSIISVFQAISPRPPLEVLSLLSERESACPSVTRAVVLGSGLWQSCSRHALLGSSHVYEELCQE